MPNARKVIISGGGTGGHVFPALAIAQALQRLEPDIDILFVGAKGKLEMEKVPKAGFPIEGLWISGLQRKLSWRNLLFPFKLISSLWKSRQILQRYQPDAVVGVGGYASGPLLEMATRKGIPSLVQEQNSFPGITNRILAKKVDRICVAFENMERFFPSEKLVVTGNPVRRDLADSRGEYRAGRAHFGLEPEKPTLLVVGGSLGAKSLNVAMQQSDSLLRHHKSSVQVLWQCGRLYEETFRNCKTAGLPNVHLRAFLDAMDLAYAAADVVIARAGALTIAELCLLGKPAILVPSPNVAEDHQTKNAEALSKKGAAVVVKDEEAAKAIRVAVDLLQDSEWQQRLQTEIEKMAKPEADEAIAREVLDLINGQSTGQP